MSTTLAKLVAKFAVGVVVDTGGKFLPPVSLIPAAILLSVSFTPVTLSL
jgi:hypothetical protein